MAKWDSPQERKFISTFVNPKYNLPHQQTKEEKPQGQQKAEKAFYERQHP